MPLSPLTLRTLSTLMQSPLVRFPGAATRRAQSGAPGKPAREGQLRSPWTGEPAPQHIDDVEGADELALSRVREKRGW